MCCATSDVRYGPIADIRHPMINSWARINHLLRKLKTAAAPPRLFDLPRRIMRDIHRGVATRPSQCRHCVACKWLAPGDPCILPGAAGNDVSAAIEGWLRLVDVAGIEGRENLVAVGICQDARSINVFFGA